MIYDLAPYATGMGLQLWTLDDAIAGMEEEVADKYVARARSLLGMFLPLEVRGASDNVLVSELIYYVAEQLFYRNLNAVYINSPFKSERIGSYGYDKGNRTNNSLSFLQDNEVIWSLIGWLMATGSIAISTRVIRELPVNDDTGIRDVVRMHDDRVARAIARSGIVSDTEEFNVIVYGDSYSSMAWRMSAWE